MQKRSTWTIINAVLAFIATIWAAYIGGLALQRHGRPYTGDKSKVFDLIIGIMCLIIAGCALYSFAGFFSDKLPGMSFVAPAILVISFTTSIVYIISRFVPKAEIIHRCEVNFRNGTELSWGGWGPSEIPGICHDRWRRDTIIAFVACAFIICFALYYLWATRRQKMMENRQRLQQNFPMGNYNFNTPAPQQQAPPPPDYARYDEPSLPKYERHEPYGSTPAYSNPYGGEPATPGYKLNDDDNAWRATERAAPPAPSTDSHDIRGPDHVRPARLSDESQREGLIHDSPFAGRRGEGRV